MFLGSKIAHSGVLLIYTWQSYPYLRFEKKGLKMKKIKEKKIGETPLTGPQLNFFKKCTFVSIQGSSFVLYKVQNVSGYKV